MTTSDCCPSHISLLVLSRQGFFRKKRVTENIPWNHSSPSVVILGVTPLTLISPIRGPSLLILEEGFSRLGVDHATFWLEEGLLSLLLTRGGETGLSGGPGELVRGLARADPPTLALRLVVGGGAGRSPPPWLFRLRPDIKKTPSVLFVCQVDSCFFARYLSAIALPDRTFASGVSGECSTRWWKWWSTIGARWTQSSAQERRAATIEDVPCVVAARPFAALRDDDDRWSNVPHDKCFLYLLSLRGKVGMGQW